MERNRVSLPAANQPSDNPIGVADEFWRDDAVALQQAEAIRQEEMRTGIRMPPPSASSNAVRSGQYAFDAQHSRSKQRSALWWVGVITAGFVVGSVACGVVAYVAGWFVFDRMIGQ